MNIYSINIAFPPLSTHRPLKTRYTLPNIHFARLVTHAFYLVKATCRQEFCGYEITVLFDLITFCDNGVVRR
jgi:hypothetical protein